ADPTTGDRVGFLGDLLHRLDKFNGTLVPAPDLFDARFNLLAIGQIDARFNLSHCAPPRVRWSDSDIMGKASAAGWCSATTCSAACRVTTFWPVMSFIFLGMSPLIFQRAQAHPRCARAAQACVCLVDDSGEAARQRAYTIAPYPTRVLVPDCVCSQLQRTVRRSKHPPAPPHVGARLRSGRASASGKNQVKMFAGISSGICFLDVQRG